MHLLNHTDKSLRLDNIIEARSFAQRLFGLMWLKQFEHNLYFENCNWIQTCFMKTPIDVLYFDKNWKICKVQHHLKPWRLAQPVFKAKRLIEMPPGRAKELNFQVGESFYVGH